MPKALFAPTTVRPRSRRPERGQAYCQRRDGASIWIPWHVLTRYLAQHVTIVTADDSGQRWRTRLVPSALRWSGPGKRSFRRQWLKTHLYPLSIRSYGR